MKIAIATENGMVSAHFGHCEGFSMYDVENGVVTGSEFVANPGHQPGFLPVFLKEKNTDVIIAGGMGGRAQSLFVENGIDVVVGAQGTCDAAIETYIKGELKSTESVCSAHEESGSCGGH